MHEVEMLHLKMSCILGKKKFLMRILEFALCRIHPIFAMAFTRNGTVCSIKQCYMG